MDDLRDAVRTHYGSAIAPYRTWWAPVLARLAEPLFDAAAGAAPRRLLDLGCGVGAGLEALRQRLPDALLVGGDPTPEMLDATRRRLPGLPLVRLAGARLPFADRSFDAITCMFVLHHIREQHRAAAEMYRVLLPGGRLAVMTWAREEAPCRAFDLWEELLDEFGAPARDPEPLPHWREAIDTAGKLTSLLEGLGFTVIDAREPARACPWSAESALGYLGGMGPTKRRLDRLSPARRRELLDRGARELAALDEAGLAWSPRVVLVVAVRPV